MARTLAPRPPGARITDYSSLGVVAPRFPFLSYRPHQDSSTIVQWLKGISSGVLLQEFPHLRKQFWGRHFWARG